MSMIINPYAFGFNPLSIAGCKLWLRADTITGLNDGQALTTWLDESGLGNNATQATAANKPLYKTNIQNGRPVVRFDGVNDFLLPPANFIASAAGYTFLVAVKYNTTGTRYTAFQMSFTSPEVFHAAVEANRVDQSAGNAGKYNCGGRRVSGDNYTSLHGGTLGAGVFAIQAASFNFTTGEVKLYANASNVASGSLPSTGSASGSFGSAVGAVYNFVSNPLYGDIAEILVYDSALPTANRQAVEAYLNAKWAIY